MTNWDEKRQHPRVPLLLQVQYPDQEGYLDDATENLSGGGAFVRTERPFALNERVPVRLTFPGLLEPVDLVGEVAWIRRRRGDVPAGVGLRIPDDRADDRRWLHELTLRLGPGMGRTPTPVPDMPFRILVADDNPLPQDLYTYALKRMAKAELGGAGSIEVLTASDGEKTWEAIRSNRLDLVLLDVHMPVLDGFGVLTRMKQDPVLARVPVLAISGDVSAQADIKAAGASAFLRKPVRLQEVLDTVRLLLRLRR